MPPGPKKTWLANLPEVVRISRGIRLSLLGIARFRPEKQEGINPVQASLPP
jgi:hypothetical protein